MTHAAFSRDSRRLATASALKDNPTPTKVTIRLWDAATGRSLGRPLLYSTTVNCLASDATGRDGRSLASMGS